MNLMIRLILDDGRIGRKGAEVHEGKMVKADDFMPDTRRRRDRVKVFQNTDQRFEIDGKNY